MSLFDFVFNNRLRIKANNKLIKLFSQHLFLAIHDCIRTKLCYFDKEFRKTKFQIISKNRIHCKIKKCFKNENKINNVFNNNNHRHVYKIKNYLNIERIKNRLTQCFIYTYRNQIYDFLIIDKIDSMFDDYDDLFDSMLNFSIYKQFEMQIIYNLLDIRNEMLYLIKTSSKSN